MQSTRFTCLIAAAAIGFGSLSYAQGFSRERDHDRRDEQWQGQRHEDRRDERRDERAFERRDERAFERREDRRAFERRDERVYYGARGPEWRRGGHIPPEYRNRQYVVENWRVHHLAPPPRGYQWVQVGNDYVLAAIATGLIAQLILNNS